MSFVFCSNLVITYPRKDAITIAMLKLTPKVEVINGARLKLDAMKTLTFYIFCDRGNGARIRTTRTLEFCHSLQCSRVSKLLPRFEN